MYLDNLAHCRTPSYSVSLLGIVNKPARRGIGCIYTKSWGATVYREPSYVEERGADGKDAPTAWVREWVIRHLENRAPPVWYKFYPTNIPTFTAIPKMEHHMQCLHALFGWPDDIHGTIIAQPSRLCLLSRLGYLAAVIRRRCSTLLLLPGEVGVTSCCYRLRWEYLAQFSNSNTSECHLSTHSAPSWVRFPRSNMGFRSLQAKRQKHVVYLAI